MNISQDDLNKWEQEAYKAAYYLRCLTDYLRRSNAPTDTHDDATNALELVWRLHKQLVRAGADDSLQASFAETRAELRAAGHDAPEPESLPLALLTSEKARRFTEAMRAAADACKEMEEERYGPNCDGFWETLDDYAVGAEFEFYGPKELRESE